MQKLSEVHVKHETAKKLNEESSYKPGSTGNEELDKYLAEKHKGYDVYPAYADKEIFVGFLRKRDDFTWDNVMTYYYNNNFGLDEVSIKENKI